jgi:hypothetical protein
MKERRTPKVEIYPHGKDYTLYVNGNYLGTYCKEILNIKLRAWHLPEIEL